MATADYIKQNEVITTAKMISAFNEKADKTEIFKTIYPVGSIYMSVNSTNPGTYFSGTTWVAWGSGRVPVGVNTGDSNFSSVEKTGGSSTHTLTEAQMPSHRHNLSNSITLSGNTGENDVNHTHNMPSPSMWKNNVEGNDYMYHVYGGKGGSIGGYWNTGITHYVNPLESGKGDYIVYLPVTAKESSGHRHSLSGTFSISGNTNYSGSSEAHNNLQPYITCYMWKRTA